MFKSKKSQKALSSLIALTFAFTIPAYGVTSVYSGFNKASAEEPQGGDNASNSSDDFYISGTGRRLDNDPFENTAPAGPKIELFSTTPRDTTGLSDREMSQMSKDEIQRSVDQHDAEQLSKKSMNTIFTSAGIDLAGGGIPISSNVRYAYVSSDGYSGRATSVCMPGNSEARHVAVNDEAKYNCYTWVSGGFAVPPMVPITVSPRKSGKGSEQITVPYIWYEQVPTKDGVKRILHKGQQIISITYNAYEAKNTMEDSLAGTSGTTIDLIPTTDDGTSSGNYGIGGSSPCADGTLVCYDAPDIKLPGDIDGSDDSGNSGWSDGSGKNDSSDDSGKNDGSDNSGKNDGSGDTNGSNEGKYSNLLNDLLNDSNSYNSGDSDWAKSNNGDGSANLDEYFNGLSDDDSLPTGLTDDVLGVDSDLDALGLSGKDTDGDGVLDTFTDANGNSMNAEEATEYISNAQNGDGSDDRKDGDGYYSGDVDDTEGGDGQSLSDFLSQFGLDGLGDGTLGSLTDENGNDSLAKRISDYISSKASGAETGDKYTITEQELYDLAKKMLLANGMSLDDIKNGRNYDKNSAYTEPATAWNMNRITTLLKDKKIKLESKDDIKKEKNNNVLTNASEKDKQIKASNEKKAENK